MLRSKQNMNDREKQVIFCFLVKFCITYAVFYPCHTKNWFLFSNFVIGIPLNSSTHTNDWETDVLSNSVHWSIAHQLFNWWWDEIQNCQISSNISKILFQKIAANSRFNVLTSNQTIYLYVRKKDMVCNHLILKLYFIFLILVQI